ncbi:MAG: hypothetical protein Q8N23_06770 [Archangium sp.]|nr:hypothetical protein [Archangium sp.]MDP3152356.1 hypothetical protein [Archangium sp.]MDP3574091.1 hypothetical protein [Archangium sp.]
MKKPLVTIIDDALPEAQHRALKRAIVRLGSERIVAGYQTTFWFPLDAQPSNRVEQAVLSLAALLPAKHRRGVTGVEWWLSRMRTSNVKVDFHRDRDNARFDQTGEETHPKISSLLYLSDSRGGLLAVTREAPNPENQAFAPDVHDFDFVTPRPNRFTFFDGRLTHGVLDANNEIPGRRLPRERKWRLAIAVNFWAERPWGVPLFGASHHYRGLALRGAHGLNPRS